MTQYYLDSSVGLRILLGHSPAAARWFDDATASSADLVISSRLLRTEMTRALRRLEDIVLCTHDRAMTGVARQLGLDVYDPVTDDPVPI